MEFLKVLKDYLVIINIIFASIIIFFERRKPVFTLFWITVLLLTSYFGFIMYLFFGLRFKRRRELAKYYVNEDIKEREYIEEVEKKSSNWESLHLYIEGTLHNRITSGNSFKFYSQNIEYFEEIKKSIEEARATIYMEYYIFDDDEVGKPIYDLLIQKAKTGLDVRVIIDGAGTRGVSSKRIKELKASGVMLEIFFPSYFPFMKIGNLRANYRDHRKITLIDNKICFSGGLNIGKDYIGKGRLGNWRDIGFRLEGDIVDYYLHEFERSWKFLTKNKGKDIELSFISKVDLKDKTIFQLISSGPNYEFHTIRDTILSLVIKAKKKIQIQTPYFVPDEAILDALKLALKSGIEVEVVIPRIPDHAFIYWVNQYFYGELIGLGAKIYKYDNGFIHSKLVVVDEEIALVGTSNFDYRSMYQNFEISVLLYGEDVKILKERIEIDKEKSKLVVLEEYKKRRKRERVYESLSKLLAPLL